MKWGVRRAIVTGNKKALDWHFQKAAKKLAKLQDIGLNSKKYAAKASAYGAAAIGTGTLAIKGINKEKGVDLNNPNTWPHLSKEYHNLAVKNKKVRAIAGIATVGLGAASAVNGYRASNAAKYREKAINFRNEMNETFKNTPYAGKYVASAKKKKRR